MAGNTKTLNKSKSNKKTSSSKNTSGKKNQTSNNRKSTTSRSSRSAKERKALEQELARQKQLRSEIILFIILAFSVFLLIANFGICGVVGDVISGFFFGVIGFCEYLFPVYMFVSAAYLISNSFDRRIVKKVLYFGVVMILLSMLFQVIYSTKYESIKVLYMDGYRNHAGGGVICGGIFFGIRTLLGVPGACIVMFILAVIMFILITGISVLDVLKSVLSSIKGHSYRDDYDDYDEEDYADDYGQEAANEKIAVSSVKGDVSRTPRDKKARHAKTGDRQAKPSP